MSEEHKEIWLTENELEKMLQGSMLWKDVASRLTGAARNFKFRRFGEPFPGSDREGAFPQMQLFPDSDSVPLNRTDAGAGNKKIAWMLIGIAACTFGLWFYYILID